MKNWKGPAKALGKEGNFILIRHGSLFYRCHHADLMKVESDKKIEINFSDESKPVNVNKTKLKNSSTTKDEEDDEDDENVDGDEDDDEDEKIEGDDKNYRNEGDVRDEDDENDEDEGDVRDVNEGGIKGKEVN